MGKEGWQISRHLGLSSHPAPWPLSDIILGPIQATVTRVKEMRAISFSLPFYFMTLGLGKERSYEYMDHGSPLSTVQNGSHSNCFSSRLGSESAEVQSYCGHRRSPSQSTGNGHRDDQAEPKFPEPILSSWVSSVWFICGGT